MGLNWSTDRRTLLKAGGALFAGLAARPHFAWAADGDTLRLRARASAGGARRPDAPPGPNDRIIFDRIIEEAAVNFWQNHGRQNH